METTLTNWTRLLAPVELKTAGSMARSNLLDKSVVLKGGFNFMQFLQNVQTIIALLQGLSKSAPSA